MNNEIITDDKQNYLSEPDENNKPRINPTYYKNAIIEHIDYYLQVNNIPRDKLNNNIMLSICLDVYESIFSSHHIPTRRNDNTPKCNIPYSQYNLTTLLELYKYIMIRYNCIPSLYGLSMLTGIDEDTFKKYVTPASVGMTNCRRELLRNLLADDKTGRIVLANNDSSFGLEYERKNTVERETIRRGLSLGDLPKLE